MVRFLIHRPIAVLVTYLAFCLLGLFTNGRLPVSLMPELDVPTLVVQVSGLDRSAREWEELAVAPIRRSLLQTEALTRIESETRNGVGIIRLRFAYGTNMDYAFLDVNEKIDLAMAQLPRDIPRPRVIKAGWGDEAVFFLQLFYPAATSSGSAAQRHLELSNFAEEVIRKRLEQLPEIALVDMTGRSFPQISIQPYEGKLKSLGLQLSDLEAALARQNIEMGNLLVRNGQYQYNLRFGSYLMNPRDIDQVPLRHGNRTFYLHELAEVEIAAQSEEGRFIADGKRAIGLGIIKRADARMEELESRLGELLAAFEEEYPEIGFSVARDQTALLRISMQTLQQSLWIGGLLAFLVVFIFLRDRRAPWLMVVSIPVSVLLSLLFFFLLDMSLNVISLSGLAMGVGLMIDNAIIVIDNITQFRQRGESLEESCVRGTEEVIGPLLSSTLTTCAVFVPLVFLSGISGALFLDQALAVIIGLSLSFGVSITLIPTLYFQFYQKQKKAVPPASHHAVQRVYEQGFGHFFRFPWQLGLWCMLLLTVGLLASQQLEIRRLPSLPQTESILEIDWNTPINPGENQRRAEQLLQEMLPSLSQVQISAGIQQFVLNDAEKIGPYGTRIYLKWKKEVSRANEEFRLSRRLQQLYPEAVFVFSPPPNLFDRLFSQESSALEAHIKTLSGQTVPRLDLIQDLSTRLAKDHDLEIQRPALQYVQVVRARTEACLTYDIEIPQLYQALKALWVGGKIGEITWNRQQFPIVIQQQTASLGQSLTETFITNPKGENIPLSSLVDLSATTDYQLLTGGKTGLYYPFKFDIPKADQRRHIQAIRKEVANMPQWQVVFEGKLFEDQQLLRELLVVLSVSVLLLYFILAAQFESLLQPFIVLLEVPLAVAAACLFLWLAGQSLNLMAMIGMVVMTGIIINDSILKIDTINRLRRGGLPLREALKQAGQRRLRPILMTSLTTILAVSPFLVGSSLGTVLQKPLAVALIGGMLMGTLISLYVIPLVYAFFLRKSHQNV
ncbi:MAG: efflux RND transporter permease subunit [Bacteroidota bacterium]